MPRRDPTAAWRPAKGTVGPRLIGAPRFGAPIRPSLLSAKAGTYVVISKDPVKLQDIATLDRIQRAVRADKHIEISSGGVRCQSCFDPLAVMLYTVSLYLCPGLVRLQNGLDFRLGQVSAQNIDYGPSGTNVDVFRLDRRFGQS